MTQRELNRQAEQRFADKLNELVTIRDRHEFLESLCATAKCPNYSARGVIYCERCLHGDPQRATPEEIALKRELLASA